MAAMNDYLIDLAQQAFELERCGIPRMMACRTIASKACLDESADYVCDTVRAFQTRATHHLAFVTRRFQQLTLVGWKYEFCDVESGDIFMARNDSDRCCIGSDGTVTVC